MFIPPIWIPSSSLTTFMILLAYRAKRSGDKLHPWRRATFYCEPFTESPIPRWLQYKSAIRSISLPSISSNIVTFRSKSYVELCQMLLRNQENRYIRSSASLLIFLSESVTEIWHYVFICQAWNCSSATSSAVRPRILFSNTRIINFVRWLIRLIVRYCSHLVAPAFWARW